MLRNIAAVVVGLIAGMVLNMVFVFLNLVLYPMPEGLDWADTDGVAEYFASLPMMAFVIVLIADVGQAFFGGWIAARISRNRVMLVAMIVGFLSLAGGIVNAMQIPLPTWMYIEMPLYLVVAWYAGSLELKRRSS